MPSLQAKTVNRVIWLCGELYTRQPRGPQLRALAAKLGLKTQPVIQTVFGLRKLLEGVAGLIGQAAIRPIQTTLAGVPCFVWNTATAKTLLYFHGGAFIGGSLRSHAAICAALAKKTGRRVIFVDYRLGPEFRHPAAVEDCAAVFVALHKDGLPALDCVFAGDSAGGNLVVTTCLKLLQDGQPLPQALACFSPWFDAELRGQSYHDNANSDAMLCLTDIQWMRDHYASANDLKDPLLSPMHADKKTLAKLPPLLIQVSNSEVLLDDARAFAALAKQAGATVNLEIWDNLPHAWQNFAGLAPEANQALDQAVDFFAKLSN